jgi:hypothetical protein
MVATKNGRIASHAYRYRSCWNSTVAGKEV